MLVERSPTPEPTFLRLSHRRYTHLGCALAFARSKKPRTRWFTGEDKKHVAMRIPESGRIERVHVPEAVERFGIEASQSIDRIKLMPNGGSRFTSGIVFRHNHPIHTLRKRLHAPYDRSSTIGEVSPALAEENVTQQSLWVDGGHGPPQHRRRVGRAIERTAHHGGILRGPNLVADSDDGGPRDDFPIGMGIKRRLVVSDEGPNDDHARRIQEF